MAVGLLVSGNLRAVNQQNGHATQQEDDVARMDVNKGGVITTTFYATLQEAFDDVPDNSFPATITVLKNTVSSFTKNVALKLGVHQNVTLDLNGFEVISNSIHDKGTAVIENSGELTITDSSDGQTGLLSNVAANPDVEWEAGTDHPYPSWANNLITNYGTVTIYSGYLKNVTSGAACYVVDNNSTSRDVKLIINGGTLEQPYAPAIRQFCNSTTHKNDVIINGGLVYGYCPIWMQSTNTNKNVGSLTINGGEIRSHADCYVNGTCSLKEIPDYIYNYGSSSSQDYSAMSITITGGTFNVNLNTYGNIKTRVSGGVFNANFNATTTDTQLSGGIYTGFDTTEGEDYLGWKYFAQSSYTAEQALQYMQNLNLYVADYSEYDPTWSSGIAWAVFDKDGTYRKGFMQDEYTKEELESLIANIKIVDYSLYQKYTPGQYWEAVSVIGVHSEYLDFKNDKKGWIVEGYVAIPCKEEGFNPETDLIITTVEKDTINVNGGENNLSDLDPDIKDDGTTEITIVPNSGENAIINITEDTKVNKIDVIAPDGKGEAQIVVKDGVTLDVGNGGVVSENDILTTILVETGGTLIIGTGGIDKEGDATPIEIKASEEKGTGTLIFNPNAKHEDTKNYAEVDLYTYCKKIGDGKYTWQQFAIPVTGLDNSKVVKTPNKTSYVFEWDYATYSWSQLNNWAQLDEPFAGYDLTNVSEDGGVVYTFKGDLIGNQNIQLTLPHKDYCVMGNSYTAPIDITALFEQISKEMNQSEGNETIEKTVYKYNAKSRYYEYINELGIILNNLGIADAPFTNIKPMEGFLLNLQNGNTAGVMLNYANAVYTPATTPKPALAPRIANTDMVIAKINVSSAHTTDLVTLVEGDEFSADIENGKDAFKYLNDGANLYAFDGTNKLAMVATDNLEGTMLAFQAAEDAEYTLTFNRALNTEYVLVDLMNGNVVAMTEGNTYTFFATPNTLDPARFVIKANAQAPTNMESTKATKIAKGIYTITGQYLGESNQWNAMPQGVYMVNGMKVIK